MPLYEFVCSHCGNVFEQLVRNGKDNQAIVCPTCHQTDVQKKLSTFAVRTTGGRAQALNNAATCNPGGA
jgi:putative FmdB family regulatory protein